MLVVQADAEIDERALKQHLKPFVEQGLLSKWAIPNQVAVVTEIPKVSVGKLDKKRIRQEIAQRLAAASVFLSTLQGTSLQGYKYDL
jgi:fatty-acyl-CoA synthase